MFGKIVKLIKIQPEEARLFLWIAVLFFLIRAAGLVFDNFAETTFLKRFGVEYLPLVYAANAVLTFFIMGAMMGLIRKMPSARLLGWLLLVCGLSVGLLRVVVAFELSLVYPVLFLLRAQYMALQALIFWNLANDLFNTRQSKRLFPLLAAGGVLGAIVGSFGTPPLARAVSVDNLMLAYMVTTVLGGAVVWRMSRIFPTLGLTDKRAKAAGKRTSFRDELREIWPLMKESTLIKVMILLTLLPNILIPIMNYQFNVIVNDAFGTEGGLIGFLSFFYGVMNVISLVILLFVGQMYSRWGLPVALMFHPANYILAFVALFVRFDVLSAIYARISTNILRVTINNPAREVLMGLFPASLRPLVRPFLRGTVVRVGILVGSGLILLIEFVFSPGGPPGWLAAYLTWGPAATALAAESSVVGVALALVGAVIGLGWLLSSIWLKRSYSSILMDLISGDVVDLKSLEQEDVSQVFQDKQAREQLVEACRTAHGPACIWYAELMKAQGVKDVDKHLLDLIRQKDEDTVIGLLPLLPEGAIPEAVDTFQELADPARPMLTRALALAASRLPLEHSERFLLGLLHEDSPLEVKATAVAGLYGRDPEAYRPMIDAWLGADASAERLAGVIAAGGSGDESYLPRLRRMLSDAADPILSRQILIALNQLDDPHLWNLVLARLGRDPDSVPREVIEDFPITGDDSVRAFIRLLGHDSEAVRSLAQEKLRDASYHHTQLLIEWLAVPNRRLRAGLYELMESLQISDLEIIAFGRSETERAYRSLVDSEALARLIPKSVERDLLRDHLRQKKNQRLDTIMRVLATQGDSADLRIVLRGLYSADARLRSNALEALESMVGRSLSRAMVPLLEDLSPAESLAAGRRLFNIRGDFQSRTDLFNHLLAKHDWVTLFLTLSILAQDGPPDAFRDRIERAMDVDHPRVTNLARALLAGVAGASPQEAMVAEQETSLSEKILLLRGMEMFAGLTVSQLAAVASVVEEVDHPPGEVIIREGEVGESMYLIVSGRVMVTKRAEDGCDVDLDEL
ncbi:MAG: cyclic nucleotide-binding domain-containing protein, partial [Proteobacteria bacterium]|nr:cyclic nucleotide-binding domain-containing protein [Pseudomonadota bacterium]